MMAKDQRQVNYKGKSHGNDGMVAKDDNTGMMAQTKGKSHDK